MDRDAHMDAIEHCDDNAYANANGIAYTHS